MTRATARTTARTAKSNRLFSLTWPASVQIYWNKRKRLHKKRVQLPEDWFGTPTWPPFHCFGTHNNFARASRFVVHFFAVTARLRPDND